MKVLLTGGLGYIGSHTAVELLNRNHDVVIIDSLYNSDISVINKIEILTGKRVVFYQLDCADEELERVFKDNNIDSVIHFAGYKAVGESVKIPLSYYYNNLMSTINVANMCLKYNVLKFIFSSSATVYGNNISPMNEEMKLLPTTNPYGETKVMCERILNDVVRANPKLNVTLLRYFNPVGAHQSGLIGEKPSGTPNNLMPFVSQVASGLREKLYVFGNDYDTVDGTGVRDYIHVVDLSKAHVIALEKIKEGVNIYNVGTGKGVSVLEIVNAFKNENKINIPYEIVDRRKGDIAECYADTSKIERELGWVAQKTLNDMARDSWNFEKGFSNEKKK